MTYRTRHPLPYAVNCNGQPDHAKLKWLVKQLPKLPIVSAKIDTDNLSMAYPVLDIEWELQPEVSLLIDLETYMALLWRSPNELL